MEPWTLTPLIRNQRVLAPWFLALIAGFPLPAEGSWGSASEPLEELQGKEMLNISLNSAAFVHQRPGLDQNAHEKWLLGTSAPKGKHSIRLSFLGPYAMLRCYRDATKLGYCHEIRWKKSAQDKKDTWLGFLPSVSPHPNKATFMRPSKWAEDFGKSRRRPWLSGGCVLGVFSTVGEPSTLLPLHLYHGQPAPWLQASLSSLWRWKRCVSPCQAK